MFGKKAEKTPKKKRYIGNDRYGFNSIKCIYEAFTEERPYSIKMDVIYVMDRITYIGKQQEFEAELKDTAITLNLLDGLVTIKHDEGGHQTARLWAVSPVETVNGHQWTGYEVVTINHAHAPFNMKDKDRPFWDVASVDHRSGRRILFIRTHSGRDSVFMATNRLNMLFNHAREALEPWRDEMIENAKAGYSNIDDIPEDEREKAIQNMDEKIKAWGKPDWDWE
ncbi:MAG: hypothetical protein JKX99_08055 [Robiginitomaculum sp.]|nr:hypothetical protein [Robiginitomaculum sp.]